MLQNLDIGQLHQPSLLYDLFQASDFMLGLDGPLLRLIVEPANC